jgi:hypothetical protein
MEKNHFISKVVPTLVSSIFYSNDIFDEEAYLQICAYGLHKVMQNGSIKDLKNYIAKTDIELCPKPYGRAQLVALVSTSKPDNFKWFCKEAEIDMETELSIGSSSSISNTHVELTLIADLLSEGDDNHQNSMLGINKIVELGLNCNQRFSDGFTILHFLVSGNWASDEVINEKLRLLLDLGADPDLYSDDGISALMLTDNAVVANYLLQQPEFNPEYKIVGKTVSLDIDFFHDETVYNFCLLNGGIAAAISRIEKQLLANSVIDNIAKKANKAFTKKVSSMKI